MALSMILLSNGKIVIGLQFDGSRGSPSLGIGVMFPTAHFMGIFLCLKTHSEGE